jgi:predicted SAM-dependent methyltransferase
MPQQQSAPHQPSTPIKLHLGGIEAKAGWTLLNAQPGPGVDIIGNCTDLSMFADGSVAEIYASHIFEHLGYEKELPGALTEANRVLVKGGILHVAVPDLEALCRIFLRPELDLQAKWDMVRVFMGGQIDPWDFHKSAFSFDLLTYWLQQHGFTDIRRVDSFRLFRDTSDGRFRNIPISLNVRCVKA